VRERRKGKKKNSKVESRWSRRRQMEAAADGKWSEKGTVLLYYVCPASRPGYVPSCLEARGCTL
jgi:hypothetical protein